MAHTSAGHNHPPEPFNPLRPAGECPRCDARRMRRAAEGLTDHDHEPLPFGRRLPYGQCPRCDQFHNGAAPRPGLVSAAQREEELRQRDRIAHFGAGGPHERGACNPVCTAFDW